MKRILSPPGWSLAALACSLALVCGIVLVTLAVGKTGLDPIGALGAFMIAAVVPLANAPNIASVLARSTVFVSLIMITCSLATTWLSLTFLYRLDRMIRGWRTPLTL